MAEPDARRLAVLIDAENMAADHAEPIFEELSKFGEANVRRVYGDFLEGSTKPWLDKLASLSIAPIHSPKNSAKKNAADIALVIDAMDLLSSSRFDGFALVSSDSDFTKLAQRIREQGIDVFGFGNLQTPQAFRMACKQFITVENLGKSPTLSRVKGQRPLNHAFQLISNVISDTSDPDGWASLGWLGQQLVQRYPDFDARSYGHKRLSDLVREVGRFEEDGQGASARIRARN